MKEWIMLIRMTVYKEVIRGPGKNPVDLFSRGAI